MKLGRKGKNTADLLEVMGSEVVTPEMSAPGTPSGASGQTLHSAEVSVASAAATAAASLPSVAHEACVTIHLLSSFTP